VKNPIKARKLLILLCSNIVDFKITELKLAGSNGIINDQVESNWKGEEQNKEEGGMVPKKVQSLFGWVWAEALCANLVPEDK